MEYQLAELFESVVDRIPDRDGLVAGGRRLTYRQLDERANRLAHHLTASGIGRGDHVGCYMMNGTEYVETMLGCFKIGAVPVNVNYRYVEEELHYLFDDADLKGIVFDAEFASRLAHVAPKVDRLQQFITVGEQDEVEAVEYESALSGGSPERDFAPRSTDDLWLLYTGGTTGMPKGVMWRHEDIFFAGMGGGNPVAEPVTSPEELAQRIDPAAEFVLTMFPAPPLMHGAAQLGTWIGFLQASKVVLVRKFDALDVVQTMAREKVNSLSIVGDAMARPIAEALEEHGAGLDLSSLLALSSAGAMLSLAVREKLKGLLPAHTMILDNFGASETGFNGTGVEGSSPDAGLRFTVNARTAVIDDDRRVVQPGSGVVGRVAQRGHVPVGYYGDPERTAETFVQIDGERWVLLGDVARVEEDGTISVLGRASLCINTGGEKVFPEEVEAALKAHPAVFDAVVTGVPDPTYGQRVAALVQLRADAERPTADELEAHCRTRVAGYKVPRAIVFVDEMQRSPSGKADYPWASRAAAEASAAAPAAS